MALSYECVFSLFTITLRFLLATKREVLTETSWRLYGNHTVIVKSTRPPHKNRTLSIRCLCGFPTIISMVYDHFLGPKAHLKNALSSYSACRAMCLRTKGLRFFKICHSAELNKNLEAMMPVNLYDDRRVYLKWPHKKGDLDMVRAS